MDNHLLITAIGLGVAYAATPGVVNTECVRKGLSSGFSAAFSIQFGALLGDGLWAVIALTGLAALSNNASMVIGLSVIGGCFLLRLAFAALRAAIAPPVEAESATTTGNLRTGLVFGLANPAGLAFWAGIGGGMLASSGASTTLHELFAFLVAFLCGAVLWSLFLSLLSSWGRRLARPHLLRCVDAFAAMVLGYFGIRMLWTGLRQLRKTAIIAR